MSANINISKIQDYIEGLCVAHKLVAHTVEGKRCFARLDSNEHVMEIKREAGVNIVVVVDLSGRRIGDKEDYLQRKEITLRFACLADSELPVDTARNEAIDRAEKIMFDFVRRMELQQESDDDAGTCGPMQFFMPEAISWVPIEDQPWLLQHFGWDLVVPFKFRLPNYNEDDWSADLDEGDSEEGGGGSVDPDIDRSHLKFTFTLTAARTISFLMNKSSNEQSSMDWGDGIIDTVDATGLQNSISLTHTYEPGTYEAKLWIVAGLEDPAAPSTRTVVELYMLTAPGHLTTVIGDSISTCYRLKWLQAISFGLTDIPSLPLWPGVSSGEPYEQIRAVNLSNNNLTGAACSRVFINCKAAGWHVGYADVSGNPGATELTTAGNVAKAQLIAQGWTIN
jgi:hypothetical protein